MTKKEKHMYKVRGKVRDLYINSDIGMEEILEVLAYDACCFTQYDDVDDRVHNFWLHIERELKKWKKEDKGKSLKIYQEGYEKDKEERERDLFGEKVFFSVGRDSEGCLSVYTPEQKRGEKPSVSFSPQFVKLLLLAGEFEYWPDEIVKGIREAWEKIEQQIKEEEEEEEEREKAS